MIYLDNAATTYPKPKKVYDEVLASLKTYGGNPGRGSHSLSLSAAEKIYECRVSLSELFGLDAPERAVFTLNTTYAINTVIKGILHQGDHVLISDLEHNSVFRPIYRLACEGVIKYSVFPSFAGKPHTDEDILDGINSRINMKTRLVFCTHASNICSEILPIKKIGELCRKRGVIFAVDAAQSAGHHTIDMKAFCIDALCVPGHKGLYGPQGCGALLLGDGVTLNTLAEGGNGVSSLEGKMPELPPERYESGTLPTPAIAGLCEGIKEIRELGTAKIRSHEAALFRYARSRLSEIDGIKIYAPDAEGSVLLFNSEKMPPDALGEHLNKLDICIRTGYHCAALAHKALGTQNSGAARISFGIYNTFEDIDTLCEALGRI